MAEELYKQLFSAVHAATEVIASKVESKCVVLVLVSAGGPEHAVMMSNIKHARVPAFLRDLASSLEQKSLPLANVDEA
jgi:hypothetical protein